MIQLIKFCDEWLICYVEQINDVEYGEPDCIIKYPYQVDGNCLGSWPVHSLQREMTIRSSNISLIVDPSPFILSQYTELVDKEMSTEEIDEE